MPNFDYGNARMLAEKSRLIPRDTLERWVGLEDVIDLLDELTQTTYERFIDAALMRAASLEAVNRMLTESQIAVSEKLRSYYRVAALEQLRLWLQRFDVQNLKTVLRGVRQNAPPHEISRALFPVGDLADHILDDLIEQPGVGEVIDRVATLGLPYAQPLVRVRAEQGLESMPAVEMSLDRWFYRRVWEKLAGWRSTEKLTAAFELDADITNLTTVLHVVDVDPSLEKWQARLGIGEIDDLFVQPGMVPISVLREAVTCSTAESAVDALGTTPYAAALQEGLSDYMEGKGYGSFEITLDTYRLRFLADQIQQDRLGISVPLGVLALKVNEIRNLRWIANGICIGLSEQRMLERMEFVE